MSATARAPQDGLAPLRRKPKVLAAPPTLHADGAPLVLELGSPPAEVADGEAGGQGTLLTDQRGSQQGLDGLLRRDELDPEVRRMARRISRSLTLRRSWSSADVLKGVGQAVALPYSHRSDDIDLDRTLERLAGTPYPDAADIVVHEPISSITDVVLIVDLSGSMRGEKVRIAAATVAALAGALAGSTGRHQLGLVGFWSDAAVLEPLGAGADPVALLDRLTNVPTRGLTNVHFALAVGHALLRTSVARRRVAVMLTDAVHNAGPDPRILARRFPELHVLLEVDGEHDADLARDLARLGHGRVAPVRTHRDVGGALSRLLDR